MTSTIDTILIAGTLLSPLVSLLLLAGAARLQQRALVLVAAACVPGLVLCTIPRSPTLVVDWLLLGSRFELDVIARVVVGLTAVISLLGAAQASAAVRSGRPALCGWWLLALTGTFVAALSADVVTFYAGFSAAALAGYGVVVHERSFHARRAALAYLAFAFAGEALVLAGLVALVAAADGVTEISRLLEAASAADEPGWVGLALVLGFGAKVGLVPLHAWMPAAYRAAPAGARMMLAGSLTSIGALGWLRFAPAVVSSEHDAAFVALFGLGAAGAFYGVARGLGERDPRRVLAWSSVSQYGLLAVLLAAAIVGSGPMASAATIAAAIFVIHHALAKAALFAIVDGWDQIGERMRWLLLALPAAALAAAPLTSGAAAKYAAVSIASAAPDGVVTAVDWLLPASSIATALLMLHLAGVMVERSSPVATRGTGPARDLPSRVAVIGSALSVAALPALLVAFSDTTQIEPGWLIAASTAWPVAIAAVVWAAAVGRTLGPWGSGRAPVIPRRRPPPGLPGGIGRRAPLADRLSHARSLLTRTTQRLAGVALRHAARIRESIATTASQSEATLVRFAVSMTIFASLLALFVLEGWR